MVLNVSCNRRRHVKSIALCMTPMIDPLGQTMNSSRIDSTYSPEIVIGERFRYLVGWLILYTLELYLIIHVQQNRATYTQGMEANTHTHMWVSTICGQSWTWIIGGQAVTDAGSFTSSFKLLDELAFHKKMWCNSVNQSHICLDLGASPRPGLAGGIDNLGKQVSLFLDELTSTIVSLAGDIDGLSLQVRVRWSSRLPLLPRGTPQPCMLAPPADAVGGIHLTPVCRQGRKCHWG
jgi:hypothetical protein